jgi:acetylornithine deacetylase/succinyl-diaminopimelate desuccinylase-like protein
MVRTLVALMLLAGAVVPAQTLKQPDWAAVEAETLKHFQALLRFDTSDPPGSERAAVDYLTQVLTAEGIEVREFATEPHRPNLVARLKGSGAKKPLLLMAHTDTVNVDPKKWTFPPFSATLDGGYVYGRGAVDDKDNVAASLMTMLMLKRLGVPLDRDVIFLAESGEEGSTRVGIQFMVNQHWDAIDAEYCLAEGANVVREGGRAKYAAVQTLEKIPYAIELAATGPAGHGSVPLEGNAVARLAKAVAAVTTWQPEIRLNETTSAFFKRLAEISEPEAAARYRAVADPAKAAEADAHFRRFEPRLAAMLRTTLSPNIVTGGYRINVIPSDAIATLDTRILPDENIQNFLAQVRTVVNDASVEVRLGKRDVRPGGVEARIDSEVFRAIEAGMKAHYGVPTLPTMSTGATDMAYLRAKGMQCYGVGPATDIEDVVKGFGAHSDQERLLVTELHRFQRFYWDTVIAIAGKPAMAAAPEAIAAPPAALSLDPFYEKYVDADGIPIIAAKVVDDAALVAARDIVNYMLSKRPDVRAEMVRQRYRVGIIGKNQGQTDLPEYRDYKKPAIDDRRLTPRERERYNEPGGIASMTDQEYWNRRARGLGGRYTTAGEENVLGLPGTRYFGEHILVHEFSHGIMSALRTADPTFHASIQAAYDAAKLKGLFKGHYGENTVAEYWAEGTQWWFWSNVPWTAPTGERLATPESLKAYDPTLFELLSRVYASHKIPADVYHGRAK